MTLCAFRLVSSHS